MLPWITALLPMVLGVVMAYALKNPLFLLMAAMSPLMAVGNWITSRRQGRISHRRQMAEYQDQLSGIEGEIASALALEQRDRRSSSPDPSELLLVATQPRSRLWERRRTDPDHLLVRVGLADLPSDIKVEDPRQQLKHLEATTYTVESVPAALSIEAAGVVGVAGPGDWPRRLARWFAGQLAVLQSPRDLQIYVLTDSEGDSNWSWATWLPHLRPALGQDAVALLGTDVETWGRRIAELTELIKARQRAREETGTKVQFAEPDVLVVWDGARQLRSLPGVVTVLLEGPTVGVYSVCVDTDETTLPEECATVVLGSDQGPATIQQQRAAQIDDILVDEVTDEWFVAVARSLAPLRDVSESQGEIDLPGSARLLDLLGLEEPTAASITSRWDTSGRSNSAVVGVSLDGLFALDLVAHGPHGLVAGTTGSGKSEFLQTLVASLATVNRPDSLVFVLVDYKGGAAFKDCVELPHTVGMVTDLDPHLVERALTSLGAELSHRERQLAKAGAKDLEDYLDYATRRDDLTPIPRLLIVIDEFASMARELPDFVTGLVNVAQRGRSLGIHLILATQRPSGVVSAEIRANTNLRIALRVTDVGESTDVIEARDAARISPQHPGRAFARLGHSALIPFQAARVGGRRTRREDEGTPALEPFLQSVTWHDLGRPMPHRPRTTESVEETTDLSVLVDAIRSASDSIGISAPRRPWLPPLPTKAVADLPETPSRGTDPVFHWALQDEPEVQRQDLVAADMATFGHLQIAGAPRSGRSQALRTIAAAAASSSSVRDLHIYGLDCGNGALLPLTRLPHCGAIVQRSETERATRLLARLQAEVLSRQRLFGEGGFADLAEQRRSTSAENRLPHLLVLLDRWEGFMGTLSDVDGGFLTEQVHMLLREGASVGVHLVIAGDQQLLSGRMGSLCEDKLVLRLADKSDATLAGLNSKSFPDNLPAGRGMRAPGAVETHVLLLADEPSGPAQVAALHRLSERLSTREADVPAAFRPRRIATLPTELTFDQAWEAVISPQLMWALVGVGGDDLEPVGVDLTNDQPTFLIAGPPRSGKSTALCVMAESLLRGGTEIVLAAPLPSPLRRLEGRIGVRGLVTAEQPTPEVLAELVDPGDRPVVLVIDDAELWRDAPSRDWLKALVRHGMDKRRGVVIAGDISGVATGFTGWQADIKKNRRGALLSPPNLMDGDLVGGRLSRSHLTTRVVPGSALVHRGDGSFIKVQVPTIAPPPANLQSDHEEALNG
jgi:S-DNA-T family DNA segregation ATPase FtsK/SpoIIIE